MLVAASGWRWLAARAVYLAIFRRSCSCTAAAVVDAALNPFTLTPVQVMRVLDRGAHADVPALS